MRDLAKHLVAIICGLGGIAGAAAPSSGQANGKAALQNWTATIHAKEMAKTGCFVASYPNQTWSEVQCQPVDDRQRPRQPHVKINGLSKSSGGFPLYQPAAAASGPSDYAMTVTSPITQAVGSFPVVTNVTSETGVGGIAGPNQYSIQLDTNGSSSTKPCSGRPGCASWLQFIYATGVSGSPGAVFMQAWLINYNGVCPKGFPGTGTQVSCVYTTPAAAAPNFSITQLQNMQVTATARTGGNDVVTFSNGSSAYRVSMSDAMTDIASAWRSADFDVVGNAGGAQAVFNSGAAVTVKLVAMNRSTAAPTCVPNGSATGETNNLIKQSCSVGGGTSPYMQYHEAN